MNSSPQTALIAAAARKRALQRQVRELDVEMGRLAREALDGNRHESRSSLAQLVGVTHTTIASWMEQADAEPAPLGERIAQHAYHHAVDYVKDQDARLVRCISGFSPMDVLITSRLDPRLFAGDAEHLDLPHMLWQLDSGEWLGVTGVCVGYGGAGPRYAHQALLDVGLDEARADAIAFSRFCDADCAAPPSIWDISQRWPRYPMPAPSIIDDHMVIHVGEGLTRIRKWDRDELDIVVDDSLQATGLYPTPQDRSPESLWLEFMTTNPPAWLEGDRVARVFLTEDAAVGQGFFLGSTGSPLPHTSWALRGSRMVSWPTVVIEQGPLQIWGHHFQDRTKQLVPEPSYTLLAEAGLYPASVRQADRDYFSPLQKLRRRFMGPSPIPEWIDVSADGTGSLQFTPNQVGQAT